MPDLKTPLLFNEPIKKNPNNSGVLFTDVVQLVGESGRSMGMFQSRHADEIVQVVNERAELVDLLRDIRKAYTHQRATHDRDDEIALCELLERSKALAEEPTP